MWRHASAPLHERAALAAVGRCHPMPGPYPPRHVRACALRLLLLLRRRRPPRGRPRLPWGRAHVSPSSSSRCESCTRCEGTLSLPRSQAAGACHRVRVRVRVIPLPKRPKARRAREAAGRREIRLRRRTTRPTTDVQRANYRLPSCWRRWGSSLRGSCAYLPGPPRPVGPALRACPRRGGHGSTRRRGGIRPPSQRPRSPRV